MYKNYVCNVYVFLITFLGYINIHTHNNFFYTEILINKHLINIVFFFFNDHIGLIINNYNFGFFFIVDLICLT